MLNHSHGKSATKGLKQPAATQRLVIEGGGGPATTRSFDPQPYLCIHIYVHVILHRYIYIYICKYILMHIHSISGLRGSLWEGPATKWSCAYRRGWWCMSASGWRPLAAVVHGIEGSPLLSIKGGFRAR